MHSTGYNLFAFFMKKNYLYYLFTIIYGLINNNTCAMYLDGKDSIIWNEYKLSHIYIFSNVFGQWNTYIQCQRTVFDTGDTTMIKK